MDGNEQDKLLDHVITPGLAYPPWYKQHHYLHIFQPTQRVKTTWHTVRRRRKSVVCRLRRVPSFERMFFTRCPSSTAPKTQFELKINSAITYWNNLYITRGDLFQLRVTLNLDPTKEGAGRRLITNNNKMSFMFYNSLRSQKLSSDIGVMMEWWW